MPSTFATTRLETRKSALGQSRVVTAPLELAPNSGEVLLQIERFALTTNNITYAAFGDTVIRYWDFFPTGDPEWGHMPVWGIAVVAASEVEGVAVGERFYGYYPIASHVRMRPERITARGFYDGMPHRKGLVSAYNQYARCSADPAFSGERADYQMLLRPLFITSFMLADFLQDHRFFGARQIVVSSASSKTAFGTAFCLQDQADIDLIALTSARNREFVEKLGCYARTVSYDELLSLAPDQPTLYLDFSGDETLRARVHGHFGSNLVYDCSVGWAQTTQVARTARLPGPEPVFFFAPDQIRKRNTDWGPQEVNERFNQAQLAFIAKVSEPGQPWMTIVESRGFEASQQLIADLHGGKVDPRIGNVVRL